MLFDFTTQKWEELVPVMDHGEPRPQFMAYPRWSHDGKYLYFSNPVRGTTKPFYRLRISDRKINRSRPQIFLMDSQMPGQPSGPAWHQTTLHSCLRDTSIQEIYALDVKLP